MFIFVRKLSSVIVEIEVRAGRSGDKYEPTFLVKSGGSRVPAFCCWAPVLFTEDKVSLLRGTGQRQSLTTSPQSDPRESRAPYLYGISGMSVVWKQTGRTTFIFV